MHAHMLQHSRGGQRAAWRPWFSPPTMWDLWGSNSGHQAWWPVLTEGYLLTENFCLLTWCVRAGLLNSITGSWGLASIPQCKGSSLIGSFLKAQIFRRSKWNPGIFIRSPWLQWWLRAQILASIVGKLISNFPVDSVLASCPCALLFEFARELLRALRPGTHSSPRDHQFLSLARGLPSLSVCLTHHPPVQ